MSAVPVAERNQDATIYVGGLDERVNESILWELFVQAGPVGKYLTKKTKSINSNSNFHVFNSKCSSTKRSCNYQSSGLWFC